MPWQPAHEAHSIERVTLSFQLSDPLPTRGWQKVLEVAGQHLPTLGYHAAPDPVGGAGAFAFAGAQGVQIRFAPAGVGIGGQNSARSFQKVVDGQEEASIVISQTGIVVTTTVYERWRHFRDSVINAIFDTLVVIQEISSINTIKLEFWDRFIFVGDPEEADFEQILRASSDHVPSFVQPLKRLWHAHVGYFDEPGRSAQRLINMNLDAVDIPDAPPPASAEGVVSSRRSLGIYTLVQDTPHREGDEEPIDDVGGTLDEMHRTLNALLLSAITDDAARRIALIS